MVKIPNHPRILYLQTRNPKSDDQRPLPELEADIAAEPADAEQWDAELRTTEIGWIKDGENVEAEFERL